MFDYRVSVIIPIYNAENTICSCIESVLAQTLDGIQVVLINDGSTDRSGELIDIYRMRENIVIIHQNNCGVSSARNIGIENADGKYVFFLDSDDLLDKDVLEKLWIYAEANELDLISCSHTESNATIYKGNNSQMNSFLATNCEEIGRHFMDMFPKSSCAKLFRKTLIDQHRIRFPVGMYLGEDMYFTFTFFLYLSRMGKMGEVFYRIQNINPSSLSKRYVPNISEDLVRQMELWNELVKRYPEAEISYYAENYDMAFWSAATFFNNLYKKDSPLTFKEKRQAMKNYLEQHGRLFHQGAKGIKKPKNMLQRITSIVLKTQSLCVIGVFFWSKEFLKNKKFEIGKKIKGLYPNSGACFVSK